MSDVFTLEEEQLTVKIKGEVYTFRAPSSKEEESLQETFKSYDVENSAAHPSTIYKDFLSGLGLPKDVLDTLPTKQILKLFSFAVGADAKKN